MSVQGGADSHVGHELQLHGRGLHTNKPHTAARTALPRAPPRLSQSSQYSLTRSQAGCAAPLRMPRARTSQRSRAVCSLWCRARCCPRRRCRGCSRACLLASSGHGGMPRPLGPWSATSSATGCRTAWAANSRLVLSASCVPLPGSQLCRSWPARQPPAAGWRRQQVHNIYAAAQASALCPHETAATGRPGSKSRIMRTWPVYSACDMDSPGSGSHCLQGPALAARLLPRRSTGRCLALQGRGQVAADPA